MGRNYVEADEEEEEEEEEEVNNNNNNNNNQPSRSSGSNSNSSSSGNGRGGNSGSVSGLDDDGQEDNTRTSSSFEFKPIINNANAVNNNNDDIVSSMLNRAAITAATTAAKEAACGISGVGGRKHVMRNLPRTKGSIKKRLRPQNVPRSNVERRRRVRCHQCEPCTRDDCGECKYCKDMKKFGGTGVSKQCCMMKQCIQSLLPTTTTCMHCQKLIDRKNADTNNLMYECEICFEIYHSKCFRVKYPDLEHVQPILNESLKNCWKCPSCVNKGYLLQQQQFESSRRSSRSTNEMTNANAATMMLMMDLEKSQGADESLDLEADGGEEQDESAAADKTTTSKNPIYKYVHRLDLRSLTDFDKQIILSEFLGEIYIDGVYYNQITGPLTN